MDLLFTLIKTGLVMGLLYGLFAYGLSLILSVNKVFHVAQGATFGLSAYIFYTLGTTYELPVAVAFLGAVAFAVLIAVAMQYMIYNPLARRDADPMVVLVASLLLVAFAAYLIEFIWGGAVVSTLVPEWFHWQTNIGYVRVDVYDVSVLTMSVLLFALMHVFLTKTHAGLEFRAVGDNPERAQALAINLDRVYLRSMILGSVLVVPAAVLLALKAPIHPSMGFDLLLKAVIALTIGGMGRMSGALLGGILVGLTETVPLYWLPTEWGEFILFIVAFAFVLLRPTGIVGTRRKPRKSTSSPVPASVDESAEPADPTKPTSVH
ncbi:branched-chain amino acid transport system permease protein [Nocardioides marinisabuli]|uniref:Branched-chain amino acid transport system permease protein n=1 Tax=Nocardioides marinisabuli TaxID=419476 RepID=A0A7Y9F1S9_9ACTN|nr:branched-chain amino acid ABC transporter permease [Nocardioides marinisabuli]NYD57185.1 branched-chain amino acid transport system permease protein [Nocardioides marinisabuli]